jgi:hypothetical protein
METRSIAIGLIAVVAAFAAAFGVAKSGGSKTPTAGAGVKAQSIKVAAPPAVAGVQVGGTLPSLKTVHKAPAKKKAKKPSSHSNTSTASTNNSSSSNTSNNTSNTATQNTQTNTTSQNNNSTVQKQTVQKQVQQPAKKKSSDTPVQSNQENG